MVQSEQDYGVVGVDARWLKQQRADRVVRRENSLEFADQGYFPSMHAVFGQGGQISIGSSLR